MEPNGMESAEFTRKEKLESRRVIVEHEGKEIVVNVDFQKKLEDEYTQNCIFVPGFGVGGSASTGGLTGEMLKEADTVDGRFIKVSIETIPQAFDKNSTPHDIPRTDVDARVALKALEQAGITDVTSKPISISGYSEGSAVAVSLAGEVDKIQEKAGRKTENTLRLFSLLSVVPLTDQPKGWQLPVHFSKEVGGITMATLVNKYNEIKPESYPQITSLKTRQDFLQFGAGLFGTLTSREGRQRVMSKWKEAQEEDLDMLQSVTKRVLSDPQAAVTQFQKIETRNPICDSLGENWKVLMSVPRGDKLYPWMNSMSFPAADTQQEEQSMNLKERMHNKLGRKLFPHAGEVELIPLGSRVSLDVNRSHVGPTTNPDLFINSAPLKKVHTDVASVDVDQDAA